ncbi:MAG TPA: BatA domain-containing protein, partial [Gemmatimonadaceae bacterium]
YPSHHRSADGRWRAAMSWLIPSALGLTAVAALVAIALHFIARSRPVAEALPTARFVPNRPVHARTRSIALTDVLLLLLRVAAIVAIGLAVAGPMLQRQGRVARVFVVDRSRAVASVGEVRDSLRALSAPADVVVSFDSAAARVPSSDSIVPSDARGSLSAALAAATNAAARLSSDADSLELVLVSPLTSEEVDAATAKIRAAWPGRIRLVPVAASGSVANRPRVQVRAEPNDAVAASVSLAGVAGAGGSVRLLRSTPTREDSAWARVDGHVLVHWPARDMADGWHRRASIDAISGVASEGATVVARFPRLWQLDGNAVARWSDGEPAAVEHATGAGCIRDVGVLIDEASDLALRGPFRRFALDMLAPCGGSRATTPIDAATRASFAGTGALAAATVLRDHSHESSSWTPWLLALAALLLIVELAMRRSEQRAS